jgi:hypothetical protein
VTGRRGADRGQADRAARSRVAEFDRRAALRLPDRSGVELGDTRAPFLINLAGFWLCGLPISVALAFRTPLRALGLWWGLVAGLAVVAALLAMRVRRRLRGTLDQLDLVPGVRASSAGTGD